MIRRKLTEAVEYNAEELIVQTAEGKVKGLRSEGLYQFRGIPYAQAGRFEKAEPVTPWEGIREAVIWGAVSPELDTGIGADDAVTPHNYWRADEHCQYLNVWTPSLPSSPKKAGFAGESRTGEKLPVIVWFHGGGWVSGSSIEQAAYDGAELSRRGKLVLVNFNSRQNVLGALDLSSFGEEWKDSVYCGLSDVLEAMRWVQRNIGAFGGDPDNVTVVGQAGGAKRALSLMQTPAADGLYRRMAIGSCAGERMTVPEGWTRKRIAQAMGELVVEELGLSGRTLEAIRTVPYSHLSEAVGRALPRMKAQVPDRFRWEPVPDGETYFDDPFAVGFRKETAGIPMMMGSSYAEMKGNLRVRIGDGRKNEWSEETVMDFLRERYQDRAETVREAFREAWPEHRDADALYVDTAIRPKLSALARTRARGGEDVWNWVFDLELPYAGGTLACHCGENPFVLHNAQFIEAAYLPGVSEKLQDAMADAWIAFARTGNPNHGGLPEWPKAGTDGRLPTMLFGRTCRLRTDHDKALQALIGQ